MNNKLYFGLVLAALVITQACATKKDQSAPLELTWEVRAANHNGTNRTLNQLTVKNVSDDVFPSSGWMIYLNGGEILAEPVDSSRVQMALINGDFLSMGPGPDWPELAPGDSLVLQVTMRPLINLVKAPHGFYLVSDEFPDGKSIPLKHRPNAMGDALDLEIAQRIYKENANILEVDAADLAPVFPTPAHYAYLDGEVTLRLPLEISADEPFAKDGERFKQEIEALLNGNSRGGEGTEVRLSFAPDLQEEAFELYIRGEDGQPGIIEIRAGSSSGVFYATQAFKTMLPPNAWEEKQEAVSLRAVEIHDHPRFEHRGFLLDVARNFHPKEQILKLLDVLSFYRINVFHFHFNDDEGWRLEIPGLPELTEVGGRRGHPTDPETTLLPSYASGPGASGHLGSGHYSRADFIEILKYAKERHIQVIPEIETPGHARAAIKSMEARYRTYAAQGDTVKAEQYLLRDLNDESEFRSVQHWNDNVIDVALPSTYTFLEKVVDEILLMYEEAGAKLEFIHMGGDEVPGGVWEQSPAVQALYGSDPQVADVDDLWFYFYDRVNNMLQYKGVDMFGWEEVGLAKTADGGSRMNVEPRLTDRNVHLNVWKNLGGNADLAYRLANAGYKVVLTNVTNFYFDMAYNQSYYEKGQHWGAYVELDRPFRFMPYEQFKSLVDHKTGLVVDQNPYSDRVKLTDSGKRNIAGIQGAIWGEFTVGSERLEYLLLPRLLGLAERAWAPAPAWEGSPVDEEFYRKYNQGWSHFLHRVGHMELPRLDHLHGGFHYRIPTPGIQEVAGRIDVNVQIPGMVVRFTRDGSEPTVDSPVYDGSLSAGESAVFRVFNGAGRGGRAQVWNP